METINLLKVRPVLMEDARQVHPLSVEMGYNIEAKQIAENIRHIIDHPEHAGFVAEKNGNILGWAHVFIALRLASKPFAEIGGLVFCQN